MSLRKLYKEWKKKQTRIYKVCKKYVAGKRILEIGGPSKVFSQNGLLPVYPLIGQLDTCNFSKNTVWDSGSGEVFSSPCYPSGLLGKQIIAEATNLSCISSGIYDGLLASHVIEHTANPLLALSEWSRVLKENGLLAFLAPHREGTFDHRRPVSMLDHLIEDYQNSVIEKDLTHLPEILEKHNLDMDPEAGTLEDFKKRSQINIENRCLHHHVFDTRLAINMIDYMRLQILAVEVLNPCHIIILARKLPNNQLPDNKAFIRRDAEYKSTSPFLSDQ